MPTLELPANAAGSSSSHIHLATERGVSGLVYRAPLVIMRRVKKLVQRMSAGDPAVLLTVSSNGPGARSPSNLHRQVFGDTHLIWAKAQNAECLDATVEGEKTGNSIPSFLKCSWQNVPGSPALLND